jgi:hypothetical protein
MGFVTDEERQEPLRVGDIPSTFAFMRRKRHLSGSGVFFVCDHPSIQRSIKNPTPLSAISLWQVFLS